MGLNQTEVHRVNLDNSAVADASGLPVRVVASVGGGGDASAANQVTEIARLTSILAQLDVALSTRATEATLALIKAKTDNLDAALSTRATEATLAALLTDSQAKADLGETQPVSLAVIPSAGGKTLTFVPVAQGAAGTTVLAAASPGNKHKLVGAVLTMSADGTLKFTDTGDLTGAMDIAAKGGFVLATSPYPFLETGAVNRALNLVTTAGLAKGVVAILTEP